MWSKHAVIKLMCHCSLYFLVGILRRTQGCIILGRYGFTTKKQTHLSAICEVVPKKKVDSAAHCKLGYSDLHLSLRNLKTCIGANSGICFFF
ncbi:hypothetical protein MKW92_033885 [Papaver armeniacum]|nr:hypothetical protein MKW92_033885 [Papaver armeniacum]